MTTLLSSATIGALARDARETAGLTQTQLAERIGASRFWVAAFEKGKPSAELGLALKAIQALGFSISIEPSNGYAAQPASSPERSASAKQRGQSALANVIAKATLTHAAPSTVAGWPSAASAKPRTRSNG